jgi:hypothetical protein
VLRDWRVVVNSLLNALWLRGVAGDALDVDVDVELVLLVGVFR